MLMDDATDLAMLTPVQIFALVDIASLETENALAVFKIILLARSNVIFP